MMKQLIEQKGRRIVKTSQNFILTLSSKNWISNHFSKFMQDPHET